MISFRVLGNLPRKSNSRRIFITCAYCNNIIKKNFSPYQLKTYKNHFCNNNCLSEYLAINLKGKNNPNFGKHTLKGYKNPFTKEHCENISKALKGKMTGINNPNYGNGVKISGENNPMWGKQHTKETKKKIREKAILKFTNIANREIYSNAKKLFHKNHPEAGLAMSKNNIARMKGLSKGMIYSKCNSGWIYFPNGKKFFARSKWEKNYAMYLEFLKKTNKIKDWEYEADTFWFEKIRRGVRSYTPDFKIFNNNGIFEYHEVKGWMDKKSQTKIKRMGLYYPYIKLIIIDEKGYKGIKRYSNLIPGWVI